MDTPVEHIHGNWPGEIPEHIVGLDYSNPAHDGFVTQTFQ
jgi:cytochrome c oxidase subunit 1